MLLDRPARGNGQVAIFTRNLVVNRLLAAIIEQWKLDPVAAPVEGGVVLVERGLPQPPLAGQVIWLVPMPLAEGAFVEVPIDLTILFHQLEKVFFELPRQHIRLAQMAYHVDIHVRGTWQAGQMHSLSDRGARIATPVRLQRGEVLTLDFVLGRQPLQVEGEVLYDIPEGDTAGREHPQVGVLFRPLPEAVRLVLRRHIERITLKQACDHCGVSIADPALSWFERGATPWREAAEKG